jgi:hypothetical protein
MRVSSTLSVAAQAHAGTRQRLAPDLRARAARVALTAASIGYLVPRTAVAGRVHSVFARACNFAWRGLLLTLCAPQGADGPTTLRLSAGAPTDLRSLFEPGERVDGSPDSWRTARVDMALSSAEVWRPAESGPLLSPPSIEANLRRAGLRIAARGELASSVVNGAAASCATALADACCALAADEAVRHIDRLVGWGEGLTPAGDDFIIGLVAALDALVFADERRRRFRDTVTAACIERTTRTTPIAGHALRLAAGGHHAAPVLHLRDALLGDDDRRRVDAALQRALAIGATSGAATASGLLAGLRAWLPAPARTAAEPS